MSEVSLKVGFQSINNTLANVSSLALPMQISVIIIKITAYFRLEIALGENILFIYLF